MSTIPVIQFRASTTPFAVLTSVPYSQSTPGGTTIPVLEGNDSDPVVFRVYNNYACAAGIATALNATLASYDGVSVHTYSMPVASQKWVHVLQNGFGESKAAPGVYTFFEGSDTAIGGLNTYTFGNDSSGAQSSQIRAGSDGNGCGFLEVKSYIRVPTTATAGVAAFALSLLFDWTT